MNQRRECLDGRKVLNGVKSMRASYSQPINTLYLQTTLLYERLLRAVPLAGDVPFTASNISMSAYLLQRLSFGLGVQSTSVVRDSSKGRYI